MGTVEWAIEDEAGCVHKIRIPHTIYSEHNRSKLLSPQHWSQEANDRYPVRNSTWCTTLDDRIILFWDQQQYKKTVNLLPDRINVGVIHSAHGTQSYERAYKSITKHAGNSIVAMPTVIVTVVHHIDDEYDEMYDTHKDMLLPVVSNNEEDGQGQDHQESQQAIPQEIQEESMEQNI